MIPFRRDTCVFFVVQTLFVSRDSTYIVSCKHEAVERLNLKLYKIMTSRDIDPSFSSFFVRLKQQIFFAFIAGSFRVSLFIKKGGGRRFGKYSVCFMIIRWPSNWFVYQWRHEAASDITSKSWRHIFVVSTSQSLPQRAVVLGAKETRYEVYLERKDSVHSTYDSAWLRAVNIQIQCFSPFTKWVGPMSTIPIILVFLF